MNEIPERSERHLTPEQTAQVEDLADKRGISVDMAERAILGARLESESTDSSVGARRKRRPTGHVRDFESDRDHQLAEERAAYELLPEDQPEINLRGRAAVNAALDEVAGEDHRVSELREEVEQRVPIDPDNKEKSLQARDREFRALWMKRYGEPFSDED